MADNLGTAITDWHRAALIAGEHFASNGPTGYYGFTPEQWLTWMREQAAEKTRLRDMLASAIQSLDTACAVRAITEQARRELLDAQQSRTG